MQTRSRPTYCPAHGGRWPGRNNHGISGSVDFLFWVWSSSIQHLINSQDDFGRFTHVELLCRLVKQIVVLTVLQPYGDQHSLAKSAHYSCDKPLSVWNSSD